MNNLTRALFLSTFAAMGLSEMGCAPPGKEWRRTESYEGVDARGGDTFTVRGNRYELVDKKAPRRETEAERLARYGSREDGMAETERTDFTEGSNPEMRHFPLERNEPLFHDLKDAGLIQLVAKRVGKESLKPSDCTLYYNMNDKIGGLKVAGQKIAVYHLKSGIHPKKTTANDFGAVPGFREFKPAQGLWNTNPGEVFQELHGKIWNKGI